MTRVNSRYELNWLIANALLREPPDSERRAIHESGLWQWRALLDSFCGYAGGLTPENFEANAMEIAARDGGTHRPFWMDIESGVRTENQFDLAKVEVILKAAQRCDSRAGLK